MNNLESLFQQANKLFPPDLVDLATPWLLTPGLVTVAQPDPLQIQVLDPEMPGESILVIGTLDGETWHGVCPVCDTPDTSCVHVVAATMRAWQWLEAQAPATPVAPTSIIQQHEPHSLTLKAVTAHGYEAMLTLRGFDAQQLFREAARLDTVWSERGWHAPYGRSTPQTYAQVQATAADPVAPTTGATAAPATAAPSAPVAQAGPPPAPGALVFHADRLEASFLNGKWYWNVFGPDMPRSRLKFGVRIWEEGLATGGFLAEHLADKEHPPDVRGFLAEYLLKADGTPDKVIRLVRQG